TYGALQHRVGDVVNRLSIRWNHNGTGFTRENVFLNAASITMHGATATKTLEFLGLTVRRHTAATIRRVADSIFDIYAAPPQQLDLSLSSSMNQIEVGDILRTVLAGVRDFAAPAFLD